MTKHPGSPDCGPDAAKLARRITTPAAATPVNAQEIEALLRRKYVIKADERQKAMGLSYLEAEVTDLAEEIARYIANRGTP